MPDSPVPISRPRTVTAAFWCWVVAAVLTAALGLFMATTSTPVVVFFRLVGVLLVLVGLAQGYLAGRARNGRQRFAAAGVGLSLASVVLLVFLLMFAFFGLILVVVVAAIMILLITGSAMNQRPVSQQWYDSQAPA